MTTVATLVRCSSFANAYRGSSRGPPSKHTPPSVSYRNVPPRSLLLLLSSPSRFLSPSQRSQRPCPRAPPAISAADCRDPSVACALQGEGLRVVLVVVRVRAASRSAFADIDWADRNGTVSKNRDKGLRSRLCVIGTRFDTRATTDPACPAGRELGRCSCYEGEHPPRLVSGRVNKFCALSSSFSPSSSADSGVCRVAESKVVSERLAVDPGLIPT